MKAKINDQTIEIFKGAKIKDLLRSYSYQKYKEVKKGTAVLKDSGGNIANLDGEINNNQKYYIFSK